jgi:hypothetical protein
MSRCASWQVEVFVERRRMHEEMLGAEREELRLADDRSRVVIGNADELPDRANVFLLGGPDGPHVLAVLPDRACDVVDLARRCGGLMGLVNALQARTAEGEKLRSADPLVAGGRLGRSVGERQQPVDACETQYALDALGRAEEHEAVAVSTGPLFGEDEHPDPGGIDERHSGQIDQDRAGIGGFDALEFLLDLAGIGEIEFPAEVDDVRLAVAL